MTGGGGMEWRKADVERILSGRGHLGRGRAGLQARRFWACSSQRGHSVASVKTLRAFGPFAGEDARTPILAASGSILRPAASESKVRKIVGSTYRGPFSALP